MSRGIKTTFLIRHLFGKQICNKLYNEFPDWLIHLDSYPVAIYVSFGERRFDTRVD